MAFDKEFFDNLDKLKNFKTKPELNDFFDAIDRLKRLCEDINNKNQKKLPGSSELKKQAQSLTKKLEEHKEEIAKRTKTQKEFEAVYECIAYLNKFFNTLNQ
ncbi:MAG: hypothetical protein WC401_08715 [Bacteroidales bacterium]|jgi:glycyl-tRNA synthetase beta subunit|nr:hypothetical protein [Bacteroidales bacterium]